MNMKIKQRDIWLVNFNPTKGHEQAGIRPAVIVSVDEFNNSAAELVFACPITTKNRHIPSHVKINTKTGLKKISYIKVEDTKLISTVRFIKKIGQINMPTMKNVQEILRFLIGV